MVMRFVGLIWVASLLGLMVAFNAYISRPGEIGVPARSWPLDTSLTRSTERPAVVVFVDSNCPCSHATMANLERCLARCLEQPETKIIIVNGVAGEVPSGVCTRLSKLPRVAMIWDTGSEETKRFGVKTSGEVLVFSREGVLVFAGGLTRERGHEGDAPGFEVIERLSAGKSIECHESFVYGCPL